MIISIQRTLTAMTYYDSSLYKLIKNGSYICFVDSVHLRDSLEYRYQYMLFYAIGLEGLGIG